jgi:hypothetical protein
LLFIVISHTFASQPSLLVFGINGFSYLSQHLAPTVFKPEDNPDMPPRRVSNRLHPHVPPPQESIIPPPPNQPPTQILLAIVEGAEYPKFEDNREMRLHQPINTSTIAEPSHNIATPSQAAERDPHQPPPREEEPDHVQIDDWDDEAEKEAAAAEEEELARVQQEIERLRQEHESMLRRQAAMQHAEAHRQNINRERARLVEMQYNLKILRQQGCEAPLHNQIPNQSPPPPPSPQHNHIPPPPVSTTSTLKSPLLATTPTTDGYHRPKKPIG